ncbi:hypothetical protein A5736_01440 [Mycobacterium sp. SP-6446]|nr:hypothetical protein A5736_01440 [Mycobacterium sp. SP-6446]
MDVRRVVRDHFVEAAPSGEVKQCGMIRCSDKHTGADECIDLLQERRYDAAKLTVIGAFRTFCSDGIELIE